MAKKSGALLAIEAEHGFVFGLPESYDTASAGVRQHVQCRSVKCARTSQAVPVHHDTLLPVVCGECGDVLLCDHTPNARVTERVEGTIVAPVVVISTTCSLCGSVMDEKRVEKEPLSLRDLPASLMAALGYQFDDKT